MNDQIVSGKWKEFKGEVQKLWGNLTGDELEKTKGNLKSIAGLIQQKYGAKEDEVKTKLSELHERYNEGKHDIAKKTTEATEDLKQDLRRKN